MSKELLLCPLGLYEVFIESPHALSALQTLRAVCQIRSFGDVGLRV